MRRYKKRQLFTESEIERVLNAARNGETSRWIAEDMGRCRNTLTALARRLGVPFGTRKNVRQLDDRNPRVPSAGELSAFIEAGKQERARARV